MNNLNNTVFIEKKPFSVTEYYSGSITHLDEEWEFTLEVNNNNDLNTYDTSVTWVDKEPEIQYIEDILQNIIDEFHKTN